MRSSFLSAITLKTACIFLILTPLFSMAQNAVLSKTSLTFNSQVVGSTSASQAVTLLNSSTTTQISNVVVSASGDYIASSCPSSIAPSGQCVIQIAFSPNAVGNITGAITVVDSDSSSPQVVSLSGSGVGPVALTPTSLSFPSTALGTVSAAKTVRVTNMQQANLSSISIAASGDYNVSGPCLTAGTLAPGASCSLSITFKPTMTGTIPGAVTITDNAAGSPQLIALTGSGSGTPPAALSFSPTSLAFNSQGVGTVSSAKIINVTNNTAGAITVNQVHFSGDFSETNTCTAVQLAPSGGACTVSVTFAPTSVGTLRGAITLGDTAPSSPQEVGLSGMAVGQLSFSPSSLTFPLQDLNEPGVSLTSKFTNNTAASVFLTSTVSGGYLASNNCANPLPSKSTCTFTVSFDPNRSGPFNGAVTVTDSSGNSPEVLNLLSNGVVQPVRYIYVANENDLTVSIFHRNLFTGQLRAAGYLYPNARPYSVASNGKFVYLTDIVTLKVFGYAVNANGTLTPISGSPFAEGKDPRIAIVDPLNRFLFVADTSPGLVSVYSIDLVTGALTAVSGSPFAVGSFPNDLAVDPAGKFLFVANNVGTGTVSAFTISSGGALNQVTGSPFPTGSFPKSLIVNPSGKFLYVASGIGSTLSAYAINSTSGALTTVPGSPFTDGGQEQSVKADPLGKFIYEASGNGVYVWKVNATSGALTVVAGSPFKTSSTNIVRELSPDADGRFLYVADDAQVTTFQINPTTGALSLLAGLSGARGRGQFPYPEAIAQFRGNMPVIETPTFAYAVNQGSNNISGYTIDTNTGALTAIANAPFTAGTSPAAAAVEPLQRFAYVVNKSVNTISAYAINSSTGALTPVSGTFNTGTSPVAVTAEPAGKFLYVASQTDSKIAAYTINQATGVLSLIGASMYADVTGTGPVAIATEPSGRFLYVANGASDNLDAYNISPVSGGLAEFLSSSPVNTGTTPSGMVVDASGQYIYVANFGSNNISGYSISPVNGKLTTLTGSPFAAGTNPAGIATDPSGRFVYVANSGTNNVDAYAINSTGALTKLPGSPFPSGTAPDSLSVDISGRYLYVANKTAGTISTFKINSKGTLTAAGTTAAGTSPNAIVGTGLLQ